MKETVNPGWFGVGVRLHAGRLSLVCWALMCWLFGLAAFISAGSVPLLADDAPGSKPDIWIVTVGSWAVLEPKFEGARRDSLNFRPLFSIRREGEREWLTLPNDGFDFEFIETDNFRAGAVANWHSQRDVTGGVPRGFRHIGSIDLSFEGGAFAEFWPSEVLRTRMELRHGVIGGKGTIADVSADAVWRPTPAVVVTLGPRLSVADSDFMRAYYTVDANLAAARGLPAYNAQAGLRSYGAGSMFKYKWSDNWTTMSFVEYQRLAGSAGNSPLIDLRGTENQVSVGLGATYTFTIGR